MTIDTLRSDMYEAMKTGDFQTKNVLSNMISAIETAAITSKGRIDITEKLVDETLIKYQKMVQEMIDTCPEDRKELYIQYCMDMVVVKKYAPQLLTDKTAIEAKVREMLENAGLDPKTANKGKAMKLFAPIFKGKADMKVVNEVVSEVLQ